jgi:hypothetical protein
VIRKGLIDRKEKVVPMAMVGSAAHDEIGIRISADRLDELENYEETKYVGANADDEEATPRDAPVPIPLAPAVYWYPPYVETAAIASMPQRPDYVREKQVNIPPDTVAVKEGAEVTSSDGHHVGKVEEVLTELKRGQITHFRIAKGTLNKEIRMIPVEWVKRMDPEELTLAVSENTVEGLPSLAHA